MSETTSASSNIQLSKFPEGLKVLVVETDVTYLQELVELLRNFHYEVTKCSGADEALIFLKDDDKEKFDVLVADLDTLDMNEFDFLCSAIAASSLPIVGFSVNRDWKYIEKGLEKGASVLFEKPVSKEAMGMLWQLAIRQKHLSRISSSSDITTTTHATSKPKPRFVWTKQVESLFVEAVNYLGGPENAVPKRIHEYMIERGMKELNSRHISSHLQKYRGDMKLLQQKQQEESSSSSAQQMQMQMQMNCSSVMLNNMSSSTLVPNYLPYNPSNLPYPSSSVPPGFHNHNNNMGMAYSSQTNPCDAFLCQPNNGASSSSSYPYPPARTMLSHFNPNPNPNPSSNNIVAFENQINSYPSNYDDNGVLYGNESAKYQMAMKQLMMDDQYDQQLPFDDQVQQFLTYTDDVMALTDQELAVFNQEDVKLSIDDQGSNICG